MARTAQAWASRPSTLMGMGDEVMAFWLDEALALRLDIEALRAIDEGKRGPLPPGLRWASEADYDDPLPAEPVAVPYPELLKG